MRDGSNPQQTALITQGWTRSSPAYGLQPNCFYLQLPRPVWNHIVPEQPESPSSFFLLMCVSTMKTESAAWQKMNKWDEGATDVTAAEARLQPGRSSPVIWRHVEVMEQRYSGWSRNWFCHSFVPHSPTNVQIHVPKSHQTRLTCFGSEPVGADPYRQQGTNGRTFRAKAEYTWKEELWTSVCIHAQRDQNKDWGEGKKCKRN